MSFTPQITLRSLDELIPYAGNSRTHTESQVAQIAGSIREFGFVNPILTRSDGTIIAGEGRLRAAQMLGMDEVPTIDCGHLTDAQARALVIADNRIALSSGWDSDALKAELERLNEDAFDLGTLGFDDTELDSILKEMEESGEQGDEEQSAESPMLKLGDLTMRVTEEEESLFLHKLKIYEEDNESKEGFLHFLMTGIKPAKS